MTSYIQAALLRFKYTPPAQLEHVPYKYLNPTYFRQPAKPIPQDTYVPLHTLQIKRL